MIRRASFAVVLLASFSLCVANTTIMSPAHGGQNSGTIQGTVTQVIEAAGYTYVEIDSGTEKVWAAGPDTPLKVGDRIGFTTDMPMANFHSKSLERDFAVIYFVDSYIAADTSSKVMVEDAHMSSQAEPVGEPVAGIVKLAGGYTIAEVLANKQQLQGKSIRVRGKVTKFSPAIMGKNWVHIMDSSGQSDLTMTTAGTASVNDIVVIEGKLALDRDFNFGYFYPVILEDGTVTKE